MCVTGDGHNTNQSVLRYRLLVMLKWEDNGWSKSKIYVWSDWFQTTFIDRTPPVSYYLIVCCAIMLFCFETMVSADLR